MSFINQLIKTVLGITNYNFDLENTTGRSSHRTCSVQKVFSKISQNWQENTCAWVSFLIKLQVSVMQLYLKKRLWHRCFPVNFAKFLGKPFFIEHVRWLLLHWRYIVSLATSPIHQNKWVKDNLLICSFGCISNGN